MSLQEKKKKDSDLKNRITFNQNSEIRCFHYVFRSNQLKYFIQKIIQISLVFCVFFITDFT